MIVFGQLYKKLAIRQTTKENHRYQKAYDDALITRLFQFNFFNFYMPMLIVAFYSQNYDNLFMMLFTKMSAKQIGMNIVEYILPILKVRSKAMTVQAEFKDTIEKFEDKEDVALGKFERDLESEEKIREYQAKRDFILMSDKPNILDNYMELVTQFGFIIFFSAVFPLAGFFSFISNYVQIKSQINNLKYSRRFKAEYSNGIGTFLNCLSNLCQISLMVNAGIIYFTSRTYRYMIVGGNPEITTIFDHKWTLVEFLVLVVVVEHIFLIAKIFIEQMIEDVPLSVIRGERVRNALVKTFRS